jgi:hypothetical protein
VDDAKIAELTAEVLLDLKAPRAAIPTPSSTWDLETRVAALEAVVFPPRAQVSPVIAVAAIQAVHPSHELLGPGSGGDRCVLEPDKPCVGSGQCRTFGY